MIIVGDTFPSFKLQGVIGDQIKSYSSDMLTDTWTILFFYPEDFSFICPTEAKAFEKYKDKINEDGGQVLGISVDDIDIHKAWIKELNLSFPLLSDDKYELSKSVGVLDTDSKAKRATFIVGPDCKIEFSMVTNRNVGRSVEETLRVFEAIQSGRMCPVDYN
ncbi:MAG: redoxin domain-containing protein [Candidatus Heimdallarchaeota archaeon]